MARKRRNKFKKNYYFTQVHEDAIVEWCKSEDQKEKDKIYKNIIDPVLNELIEKIIFTYKFTSLPNVDILREDCKAYTTTVLTKFNPDKGSKAFTYFSVVVKNWFIHQVKKTRKRFDRELSLEGIAQVKKDALKITVQNNYHDMRENAEFWNALQREIDGWSQLKLRDNEKKVVETIKVLIENVNDIEIFNKKAIYLYMREISGLNTKQIVNSLTKIRARYRDFKKGWVENG